MKPIDPILLAKLRQFNVLLADNNYTESDLSALDSAYVSLSELISTHGFNKTLLYRFDAQLESSRVKFEGLPLCGDNVKRYLLATFLRKVIDFLDKRNLTFLEFKEHVAEYHRAAAAKQYAKRKAVHENEKPRALRETKASAQKLSQVIDIIHLLTCKHPKAHAAFQAKLNPIGVYLPTIATQSSQSNDNEGESP
jgi:hypothetical protein